MSQCSMLCGFLRHVPSLGHAVERGAPHEPLTLLRTQPCLQLNNLYDALSWVAWRQSLLCLCPIHLIFRWCQVRLLAGNNP